MVEGYTQIFDEGKEVYMHQKPCTNISETGSGRKWPRTSRF